MTENLSNPKEPEHSDGCHVNCNDLLHSRRVPLTFGSLFAGIGGLDLGLERAGMVCRWQVEIDDYATAILERHWPDVPRWRDVRTFPGADTERVTCIAAGFPCQDISYAGRGAGLAGERSGLFYEAIRVVRQLRPRFVLLENVAALLTRGLDAVLGILGEIGYDAEWHCISAASVGAPHIRERIFILADAESNRDANRGKRTGWPVIDERTRWDTEPGVGRVVDGVPTRMDKERIRCLGNAVVPQVAEWIGRRITEAV